VSSLLNHSCDPNVTRVNDVSHGTMAIITTRAVKKGESLTASCGVVFEHNPLSERKTFMKTAFQTECQCTACKENWPTEDIMGKKIMNPVFTCSSCSEKFRHEEKSSSDFDKCCLQLDGHEEYTTCGLCQRSYLIQDLQHLNTLALDKYLEARFDLAMNRPLQAAQACRELAEYFDLNIRPPYVMPGKITCLRQKALASILHFADGK